MKNWNLEDNVNDWVKGEFARIKQTKYTVESAMSPFLKEAIQKGVILKRLALEEAGEKEKGKSWKPDFELETFDIPVLIENKLGSNKLSANNADKLRNDIKSVQNFAVNGAIHYAQCAIMSKKYTEAIAIGISGDNPTNITIQVYYVFGATDETYKLVEGYTTLDFLESKKSFTEFYKAATLTEDEKHKILIDSQAKLQEYAKKLNKLMHNHAITAPQRVLYVSGMLLAMQDIAEIKKGLVPEDLKGFNLDNQRDGDTIVTQIENYLTLKTIPLEKKNLMMASFKEINKDTDRDKKIELDIIIGKLLPEFASVNKQIFTYIYENIFLSIDSMSGHLDIMGEMYSEFLKYALGDGKEIGIVLTPPYVTKMMTQILEVDENSKVMDLATGSAGFLISSMQLMIECTEEKYGKKTKKAIDKIEQIKKHQLLGVELDAQMFTLASTNMILRGDGSSNIRKGSSFKEPAPLYEEFNADKLLLNPPFSFKENGMPFILFGLSKMQLGGKAAIIIQDSAGSGRGVESCRAILSDNQLLASIKMPVDLFQPMAGVQTSIYVVEHTGKTHDYRKQVKFIDFRNDGYKRTKRGTIEIDNPVQRYNDIIEIYKNGTTANVSNTLWDLKQIVTMSVITPKGNDWNYELYQKIDTKPTLQDFKKTVGDYLAWEVANLLKQQNGEIHLDNAETVLNKSLGQVNWGDFKIKDVLQWQPQKEIDPLKLKELKDENELIYPFYGQATKNNGIISYHQLTNTVLNNAEGRPTILVHSNNQNIVYVETPFYLKDGHGATSVLQSDNLNKTNQMFIIAAIDKVIKAKYSYNNKATKIELKNSIINLPTSNNEVDFEFMNRFITDLEAQRIAEIEAERVVKLDAHLLATGLKDYFLTDREQQLLNDFSEGKIVFTGSTYKYIL